VTIVQRISLLTDLAVLVWFQNRQARRDLVRTSNSVIVTLLLAVIVVLVNVACLNVRLSWEDAVISRYRGFTVSLDRVLCPRLNWGCRSLQVDHHRAW
jgi:hypothetical protein